MTTQKSNKTGLLLVVFVLAAIGSALAFQQTREISGDEYRTLRLGYTQGPQAYRVAIAQAMDSGTVNRWEYRHLIEDYQGGNVEPGSTVANQAEQRVLLGAVTRPLRHNN